MMVAPFPHAPACASCRDERRCNYCGVYLVAGLCTNGRCRDCHATVCTAGGATYAGHGFGNVLPTAPAHLVGLVPA